MLTAAAATAAESFSPAIPTRAVRQTAGLVAQSAVRFDRAVTHQRTTEKRTNKGTCAYCGTKNSAMYECADCKIPLHFPGVSSSGRAVTSGTTSSTATTATAIIPPPARRQLTS